MSPWAEQLFVDVFALCLGGVLLSPFILQFALALALAVKVFRKGLKD